MEASVEALGRSVTALPPATGSDVLGKRGTESLPWRLPWERRRSRSLLISALSWRRRVELYGLAFSWLIGVGTFLDWLWQPAHWSTGGGMAVVSALVILDVGVLPAWLFFFIARAQRPDPAASVPHLRCAIVITKAPAEPWPVVRTTLTAALAQEFEQPHAVWLADELPGAETRQWCRAHGVRVATRRGVHDYQRPAWPRRRRCKEGNLAFFYDFFGYRLYDVVAQLDADHAPAPDYLSHMVAPFRDPAVGYVAAPSICDRNASRSWAARGRLHSEAVLHGAQQAGCNGGWAPSCIGSHYAVRTAALEQVGGLGPELAEDFSTTLILNAGGWKGVFALNAEAHGDGPESLGDGLTQEFQWSRSMVNVLLRHCPRYWAGLPLRAKIRLGFCQLWYPLFGLMNLAAVVLPTWALITRVPLVSVSLPGFALHAVVPAVATLGAVIYLRRLRLLRPVDAPVVSWEALLFQVVRWPWALIGCAHALAGCVTRREFEFRVTPKRTGGCPLPAQVVAPLLVLCALALGPAVFMDHAGRASGYFFWALINSTIYCAAAIAVVALHVRENRAIGRRQALGSVGRTLVPLLILVVGLGVALDRHVGHPSASSPVVPASRASTPWPIGPNPAGLDLGVAVDALAKNETWPWKPSDLAQINGFEHQVRQHVGSVLWFADFAHSKVDLGQLRAVAARGATPEITLEPWDHTVGVRQLQPQYSLASIAAGRFDGLLRRWADGLRAYAGPVRLRFAQEMNGSWYPWGRVAGNAPGTYARAWRHVHDIFFAAGATNVRWVWSPVAGQPIDLADYPGDQYVDVLGLSGFNGGSALPWQGWRSFSQIFGSSLVALSAFAPSKPIEISEVSSAEAGGDKGAFITGMFKTLRSYPHVRRVQWFDLPKQTDWRVNSSPGSVRAMAAALATPGG